MIASKHVPVSPGLPPNIGPIHVASFDYTISGRRFYSSNGSYGSPNFLDDSTYNMASGTWPDKRTAIKWKKQIKWTAQRFENGINGVGAHFYDIDIGGTQITSGFSPQTIPSDSGWFDIADGVFGEIKFHDYTDIGAGGTAFTGQVDVYIRYARV
jgi:hypothetical protein